MKVIVQEDSMGCGVACVASVLGINYSSALLLFKDGKLKANTAGFYCKNMVDALKKHNLRYSFKKAKEPLRKIPDTIIFIERSSVYPEGHYLAETENGWMDPWVNFPNLPRKAGIRKILPGKPEWIIFKSE